MRNCDEMELFLIASYPWPNRDSTGSGSTRECGTVPRMKLWLASSMCTQTWPNKNQMASVNTDGPISKMWSSKNIRKELRSTKLWLRAFEKLQKNRLSGDENCIIFAWGITETTSRLFCPVLDLLFRRMGKNLGYTQKFMSKWDKVWKLCQKTKGL